jgi:hypothetical protein
MRKDPLILRGVLRVRFEPIIERDIGHAAKTLLRAYGRSVSLANDIRFEMHVGNSTNAWLVEDI